MPYPAYFGLLLKNVDLVKSFLSEQVLGRCKPTRSGTNDGNSLDIETFGLLGAHDSVKKGGFYGMFKVTDGKIPETGHLLTQ
jgi:hypothetical protein